MYFLVVIVGFGVLIVYLVFWLMILDVIDLDELNIG